MTNTRMALARLFAALSVIALPANESYLHDIGFRFLDDLKQRARTIRIKGKDWRAE